MKPILEQCSSFQLLAPYFLQISDPDILLVWLEQQEKHKLIKNQVKLDLCSKYKIVKHDRFDLCFAIRDTLVVTTVHLGFYKF